MDVTKFAARKNPGPKPAAGFVASNLVRRIRRFIAVPDEEEIATQLESRRVVRPRLSHQRAWAVRFRPDAPFLPERGAWRLLQNFTLPLTRVHATEAHRRGIDALGLSGAAPPTFTEYRNGVLLRTGWQVLEARGELSAESYFSLLAAKKFPCIARLRPVSEVLCGSRPDFWHESVGHIAALVDPEVSRFYQRCAELHVRLVAAERYDRARELEKLLWVVFEYGFLKEAGEDRAFGAAVAGSFVALTKWRLGRWVLRPFDVEKVLASGLFEENREPARDPEGRLIFYRMDSLERTYRQLREFADSAL